MSDLDSAAKSVHLPCMGPDDSSENGDDTACRSGRSARRPWIALSSTSQRGCYIVRRCCATNLRGAAPRDAGTRRAVLRKAKMVRDDAAAMEC